MCVPSNCVCETVCLGRDVLEVPDRLARLLGVRVLHRRHHARPHQLVRVRLNSKSQAMSIVYTIQYTYKRRMRYKPRLGDTVVLGIREI